MNSKTLLTVATLAVVFPSSARAGDFVEPEFGAVVDRDNYYCCTAGKGEDCRTLEERRQACVRISYNFTTKPGKAKILRRMCDLEGRCSRYSGFVAFEWTELAGDELIEARNYIRGVCEQCLANRRPNGDAMLTGLVCGHLAHMYETRAPIDLDAARKYNERACEVYGSPQFCEAASRLTGKPRDKAAEEVAVERSFAEVDRLVAEKDRKDREEMHRKVAEISESFDGLRALGQIAAALTSTPSHAAATSSASPATSSAQASPPSCNHCEGKCQSFKTACANHNMAACYRGASCLCSCFLAEGGCGNSETFLRSCISDNDANAAKLGR